MSTKNEFDGGDFDSQGDRQEIPASRRIRWFNTNEIAAKKSHLASIQGEEITEAERSELETWGNEAEYASSSSHGNVKFESGSNKSSLLYNRGSNPFSNPGDMSFPNPVCKNNF